MKKAFLVSVLLVLGLTGFAQNKKMLKDSLYFPDEEGEKIYKDSEIDKPAEYIAGETELFKYISNHVNYPVPSKKNHISGKVYACFVIEKNGNISNVAIIQSPDNLLADEVIRLVVSFPKNSWKAAVKNGEPVRSQFILPISFALH
jgi:outer membrane biosynthesis protein TonB